MKSQGETPEIVRQEIGPMAKRTQKFSIIHMLLMAAIMIWLPSLVVKMAGIAPNDSDAPGQQATGGDTPQSGASVPVPVDAVSQTGTTPSESDATGSVLNQIRPAPSSLKLTETLLSSAGKTAIINGRAFGEQEMISPLGFPYRIRTILPGRVILEGDGGLYELRRKTIW